MKDFYPGAGTALCPHCGTLYNIANTQLETHPGMVRCGHCLHAFDTRPNIVPEQIDPQLELPLLEEPAVKAEPLPAEELVAAEPASSRAVIPQLLPRAGQYTPNKSDIGFLSKRRSRLWTFAALLLLLLLLAQAAYMFRVELAARLPGLKPALIGYCKMLKCSVPLPQKASLMSIESSELKDDPLHRNQIMLIALLRNRASYSQAYPHLELTLTDSQDKALARRIFRPEDYLPAPMQPAAGLPANQELAIKLHLDTADLKPLGYRLVLFYANARVR